MNTKEEYYTKTDSKIIKGLAIILMLIHHLWLFPDRIAGPNLKYLFSISGQSSIAILGGFGKICVSLFFFVGGYGIYIKSKDKDFNLFANIKKIYTKYWHVFLIFIPLGFIFFNNQIAFCEDKVIYTNFAHFNLRDLLANFFGLSSNLNREWWFLRSYIIAIITFPFIKNIFKNKDTSTNVFIIIIATILMYNIFPVIGNNEKMGALNNNYLYTTFFCQMVPYVSCFWLGILFAKDDLFKIFITKINGIIKLNPLIDILGIISIIYIRQFIIGEMIDLLYVPILIILFLDLVKNMKIIKKTFLVFGNHSANMWLVHSFFCYYFYIFSKTVTYFRWSVPCLIVLILLSLITSIIIDFIWKIICLIINKITKRNNNIV